MAAQVEQGVKKRADGLQIAHQVVQPDALQAAAKAVGRDRFEGRTGNVNTRGGWRKPAYQHRFS